MPTPDLTRRDAVTAVAAGFALAVQPVSAETIVTDDHGLVTGDISIPTSDREIPGYRAAPAAGGPFPTIVVVQEIFGVHEHIRDICRRFAKRGYLAVAADLYVRQGDVTTIADIQQIIATVVSKVPDAQVMADLDATVSWAKDHDGDTARLGVTGFCWGGRITWLYAAHNPQVKAGVAWYGRLVTGTDDLHPRNPIDVVGQLHAAVLGLYGGADQAIPVESVERMRDALRAAGKPSEIVLYPDTPHGFHADYRPTYREEQARDAWTRCLDWFKKNGVS